MDYSIIQQTTWIVFNGIVSKIGCYKQYKSYQRFHTKKWRVMFNVQDVRQNLEQICVQEIKNGRSNFDVNFVYFVKWWYEHVTQETDRKMNWVCFINVFLVWNGRAVQQTYHGGELYPLRYF